MDHIHQFAYLGIHWLCGASWEVWQCETCGHRRFNLDAD
jgi:hypothetical protein